MRASRNAIVGEHLLGMGTDLCADACGDKFSDFLPVFVVEFNR
jgi:hypothetical protein